MTHKKLHLVSFDNPYPPNYGGVIDVFYKIKALHKNGVEVYLHFFYEGKLEIHEELKAVTKEIFAYPKKKNPFYFLSIIPFSVRCRFDKQLIINLKKFNAPILFDSIKTTFVLTKTSFEGQKLYIRLHNIEKNYFKGAFKSETNFVQKTLHFLEFQKFKSYEKILSKFEKIYTISKNEQLEISKTYTNSIQIPVFHGNKNVKKFDTKGEYVLYHGDLITSDNRKVVQFLINVFKELKAYKLVLASGSYQNWVRQQIENYPNIEFIDLKNNDLDGLFQQAQINISWSFQESGTKLKLINALYKGRFSIINKNIIDDKNIEKLCYIANDKTELTVMIQNLMNKNDIDFETRQNQLNLILNDDINVLKLIECI